LPGLNTLAYFALPSGTKYNKFFPRLEPIGDPFMKVEWFCNGKPLTIGSRFRTYNDFGFIALDIISVNSTDAGKYVCRATNQVVMAYIVVFTERQDKGSRPPWAN
jgi:hypothetical protein